MTAIMYASHYLISVLLHKGVHFVFRMKVQWNCVKQFKTSNLKEQVVDLEVYKYSLVAKRIPINVNKKVRVRLVKKVSRSGEVRVYATSMLDEGQYSRKSIINLYKQRWGVEEACKTLKARLDVIHFSGKTLHAVQQDFYARVFLISLTSILKAEIKPVLKTKPKSNNKDGRLPMINNSFAISQTKRLIKEVYYCFERISDWIKNFVRLLESAIEYSRKGQANPRSADRGYNRVFSQSYKTI